MKTKILSILWCLVAFYSANLKAQGIAYTWAKSMGSAGLSVDAGNSIAVDASGNIYTTGYFQGTADFDPNTGVANLTSAGMFDIFISKLDISGNFVWAKRLGGSNDDNARSIVVDASGNVYTTGNFQGTVDFDPNAGVANLTSTGLSDIFICKLDPSGNFVWAKNMGGGNSDGARSIAVDASGNIYTTGSFGGTADFDPNAGVANLTSAGGDDIFISKLDASGNFVWAKRLGAASGDVGNSIVVDASGNVYTTGNFQGTVDFDPNTGIVNLTSAGSSDIFISKLDASGNFVWAKRLGAASGDVGNSIVVDASGNVYTTGNFQGTVDFDPNTGIVNLTSAGSSDIFISKLDASGNFVWAKIIGTVAFDEGTSIIVDATNNVYTTGSFIGTVDFDPNAGIVNLTSAGSSDIFISKLDASGNFVWAKNMGGTSNDNAHSSILDASGNIYITGAFAGTSDFDPNAGVANLTSVGSNDIFVAKYVQCPAITVNPTTLPNATVGTAYNQTVTQTGLSGAVTWSISAGNLPAGLSLNTTTGAITGTPTASGTSNFTIQVASGGCSTTQTFTIITEIPNSINNPLSNLVKVFPNPSTGVFTIHFDGINAQNAFVNIYNIQGKKVLVSEINTNMMDISLETLSNGIYFLEVETSQGRILKRLAKL
ncbi:MAG: SBBP repeat-containing protein [Raineya sp.]|jgi:hypothetical protein|nr:SBBP repeat-containing protein [Raineya sp.]